MARATVRVTYEFSYEVNVGGDGYDSDELTACVSTDADMFRRVDPAEWATYFDLEPVDFVVDAIDGETVEWLHCLGCGRFIAEDECRPDVDGVVCPDCYEASPPTPSPYMEGEDQ